jgi:phosphoribosyl 1,2-cyclic phosphodiesterase
MKVKLWGTRGSLANAGSDTVRYGGNTSCVEVRSNDGSLLILDAGTGIRRLGESLNGHTKRIDILLTHLHMDHIQGLGFFGPLFNEFAEVHIWGPHSSTLDLRQRITRYLSPPLFPVMLRDIPSKLKVISMGRGEFDVGAFHIRADLVCHPGFTYGYRVTVDGKTLAYLPDHELPLASPSFDIGDEWVSGLDLARDADVLIHDTQYTPEEYPEKIGWGHSDFKSTLKFALLANVKRLITFHHDPAHDDQSMDALIYEARGTSLPFTLHPGTEGLTLEI